MLNVIPMVTTKKIAIEYIQKEIKNEFKQFTTEKSTQKKVGMQEMTAPPPKKPKQNNRANRK